jgi:hypothetical protein
VHVARAATRLEQARVAGRALRLAQRVQGGRQQRLELRVQADGLVRHMIGIICASRRAERHSRCAGPVRRRRFPGSLWRAGAWQARVRALSECVCVRVPAPAKAIGHEAMWKCRVNCL